MELHTRPLVKGALSFVVPTMRSTHHAVSNSTSAEYCYSVFLRHYSRLSHFAGGGGVPAAVAELGPGDTLGAGLAALLAGADRYYALDVQDHTDVERNLRVFEDLVLLFRRRSPVPRIGHAGHIFTEPRDWHFPASLGPSLLASLAELRLDAIRDDLARRSGRFVRFVAPWFNTDAVEPRSVGWIFSHSVMEHVDDVADAYRCCARWLADGGHMTHEIDYRCHNLTEHWNGHWAVDDAVWRIVRGRRPYLINRLPHHEQLRLLAETGFEVLEDITSKRDDGLGRMRFSRRFSDMSDSDARTHLAFVICRLSGRAAA